jgi:transmembrane sensor
LNKEKLQTLLKSYLDNTISDEDFRDLLSYYKEIERDELDELIDPHLRESNGGPLFRGAKAQQILAQIKKDPRFIDNNQVQIGTPLHKKLLGHIWLRIAAALVLALFVVLFINRSDKNKLVHTDQAQIEIAPGTKKAILTLANGQKINLNEVAVGELASEGNVSIRKTNSGQLIYDLSKSGVSGPFATGNNIIETPKGGEYHVILPDGTLVWLNSASSLSFPTKFSGSNRNVTLKGEAYFEVAHNKNAPFHVHAKGSRVDVLGTHFNISAYDDDADFITTLLEGSVSVSKNNRKSLLVPGQQSVVMDGSDNIAVRTVNVEDVMAWHNGYFRFNDEDIKSILKKISRWYDVEVEYRNTKQSQQLGGMSYRTKSLNDLLIQLEKIGNLHFKLEGRRVIVLD